MACGPSHVLLDALTLHYSTVCIPARLAHTLGTEIARVRDQHVLLELPDAPLQCIVSKGGMCCQHTIQAEHPPPARRVLLAAAVSLGLPNHDPAELPRACPAH